MRAPHSFDIFDTLIARRCIEPGNIFLEVEHETGFRGFAHHRVQAEARVARNADYRLDDIYTALREALGLSGEVADYLKQCEIAAEIGNVIPIRDNLDRVQDGDILITDMYLPAHAIRQLLAKAGLHKQVGLVISSSGKHRGSIWPKILDVIEIEAHAGDNQHSDVRSPLQAGVFGEHRDTGKPTPHESFLRSQGFELLARALRETRLTLLHAGLERQAAAQILLQLNCNLPILILAAVHVKNVARARGCRSILLSSRDCYRLHRIYTHLSRQAHWPVLSEYFYTSRVSRLKASDDYLAYFRSSARDALVVDLCGTGWSLSQLYQRAGFVPATFLLHDISSMQGIVQAYEQIRKSSARGDILSLVKDVSLDNRALELVNYIGSGMVLDVRVVAGVESVIPVIEGSDYPDNVTAAIARMDLALQTFLDVLRAYDVGEMVRQMERKQAEFPAIVAQLYKSLAQSIGCMDDVAAYHARQDRKSMWKLKRV